MQIQMTTKEKTEMAIMHMNISSVCRAGGSNACATESYITGRKTTCERTGETFDYGRKQRVLDVQTFLPKNAKAEWSDPRTLANAIETYETKSNAVVAKKIEIALPRELSLSQQKALTKDFIQHITKQGYACISAIHNDNDNKNPHVHLLIPNRPINTRGEFVQCKSKKVYVLDAEGNRVPQIDKATGQQKLGKRNEKMWQRKTVKSNWIGERDTLIELRQTWQNECNKWLDQSEQIDCRSHEERGLQTVPTIHEGYVARAMEKRGEISERCEINREIRAGNIRILSLLAKLSRAYKRNEQAQERFEQTLNAVQTTTQQLSTAVKSTSSKLYDWWQNVAQPALTDAITPTEIDRAHSDEWDNLQETRHTEKQQARLNELSEQKTKIIKNGNSDDLRWFNHQHKEEMDTLDKEIIKNKNKTHTVAPAPTPDTATKAKKPQYPQDKPKKPTAGKVRRLSPLELQQIAQTERKKKQKSRSMPTDTKSKTRSR